MKKRIILTSLLAISFLAGCNSTDDSSVLESISVSGLTKTSFEMGEEIKYDGLKITAIYKDNSEKEIPLSEVSIDKASSYILGEQNVNVTYQDKSTSFAINVIRTYSEEPDSIDGVDVNDFSELYAAFNSPLINYSSDTYSYFNPIGLNDYYRHYQNRYAQAKRNFYTSTSQYTYPYVDEFLPLVNKGYYNLDNDYYSFSLKGDTVEERLDNRIHREDLTLEKSDSAYQEDMFTLKELNEEYFLNHSFARISENKYASTEVAVCEAFLDIVAPTLINQGHYMTFIKVTIELLEDSDYSMRIRLYASSTQSGKLVSDNFDTSKPNWYLLFSEAYIYNIGTTSFPPINSIG